MATIRVQVKGIRELQASFDKAPDEIRRVLHTAVKQSGDVIRKDARKNAGTPPIVNTGELSRNIQNKTVGLTSTVDVSGSAKKYGYVVEGGRRPGSFPPVAPIERWAKTKLGKPGLGFVIARKIARKGTKAQPFMKPAVVDNIRNIENIFNRAIDFVLKRL